MIRLQQQEDKEAKGEAQKYMQTGNLFDKLGMFAHLLHLYFQLYHFFSLKTQYLGPITCAGLAHD